MKRWTLRERRRGSAIIDPAVLPKKQMGIIPACFVDRIYDLENRIEKLEPAELEPCPNCGSEQLQVRSGSQPGETQIICRNCGCAGPSQDTPEGAVWAWNTLARGEA